MPSVRTLSWGRASKSSGPGPQFSLWQAGGVRDLARGLRPSPHTHGFPKTTHVACSYSITFHGSYCHRAKPFNLTHHPGHWD